MTELQELMLEAVFVKTGGRDENPEIAKVCADIAEEYFTSKVQVLNWLKYPKNKPEKYGKYWVYRKGCDKVHTETWNGSGWAYNSNDITDFTTIKRPIDYEKEG